MQHALQQIDWQPICLQVPSGAVPCECSRGRCRVPSSHRSDCNQSARQSSGADLLSPHLFPDLQANTGILCTSCFFTSSKLDVGDGLLYYILQGTPFLLVYMLLSWETTEHDSARVATYQCNNPLAEFIFITQVVGCCADELIPVSESSVQVSFNETLSGVLLVSSNVNTWRALASI